jgi:methylenetetrahydrofolate reductase (NADPH)
MNAANTARHRPSRSAWNFSAQDARRREKLRAVRQQLYALQPEFCSVTYGAGAPRRTAPSGTCSQILDEGQQRGAHFTCIGATRAVGARELALLKGMGVRRWWRCAAICPAAMAAGGEFQLRQRLVAFIRAETGDATSTSRWPPTPRCTRRRARPRPTCRPMRPRCARVPIRPSRSISSTADAYFRFVDEAHKLGADMPVVPGIMPIIQLHAADALFRQPAAPRFRAGSGCACRVWRRHRVDQGLWPGCGDRCASSAPARCAQPALLHHESKCNHAGNLPAPRFVMGRGARRVLGLGPGPVCIVAGEGGWNCHLAVGTFVFSQRGDRCRCLTGCGAGAP